MYTNFEFNNKLLSDYNCIMCNIDEGSGVSEIDTGCDITFNTVKNNFSSVRIKTSTSYENVCETTFCIAKNPCFYNGDEQYLTEEEVRDLMKWLNVHEYKKFKPLDLNNYSDVHYYGSFNIKKKKINDSVIGLSLTFVSNAPYGVGEKNVNEFELEKDDTFYIYGDSDEYQTVYPNLTIVSKSDCDLQITNNTSGTCISIGNVKSGEIIKLDGEHKICTTDNAEHTSFYKDYNYEWFDILIDEDVTGNEYTVNASVYITVEYEPIRKVGIM